MPIILEAEVRLLERIAVLEHIHTFVDQYKRFPSAQRIARGFAPRHAGAITMLVNELVSDGAITRWRGCYRITPRGWVLLGRIPRIATSPDNQDIRRYDLMLTALLAEQDKTRAEEKVPA